MGCVVRYRSDGFIVHNWESFGLPGIPVPVGALVGVGTGVGVDVGVFVGVGVGLDVSGVGAFVEVDMILGVLAVGLSVGTLVGAGVETMVYCE